MRLQIHVFPPHAGPDTPALHTFLEIASPSNALETLSFSICSRYSRLYPHKRPLIIHKLQDNDCNDLDLSFTVGDIFTDKSANKNDSIVRVIQASDVRGSSIPPESSLRSTSWRARTPAMNSPGGRSSVLSLSGSRPEKRRKIHEEAIIEEAEEEEEDQEPAQLSPDSPNGEPPNGAELEEAANTTLPASRGATADSDLQIVSSGRAPEEDAFWRADEAARMKPSSSKSRAPAPASPVQDKAKIATGREDSKWRLERVAKVSGALPDSSRLQKKAALNVKANEASMVTGEKMDKENTKKSTKEDPVPAATAEKEIAGKIPESAPAASPNTTPAKPATSKRPTKAQTQKEARKRAAEKEEPATAETENTGKEPEPASTATPESPPAKPAARKRPIKSQTKKEYAARKAADKGKIPKESSPEPEADVPTSPAHQERSSPVSEFDPEAPTPKPAVKARRRPTTTQGRKEYAEARRKAREEAAARKAAGQADSPEAKPARKTPASRTKQTPEAKAEAAAARERKAREREAEKVRKEHEREQAKLRKAREKEEKAEAAKEERARKTREKKEQGGKKRKADVDKSEEEEEGERTKRARTEDAESPRTDSPQSKKTTGKGKTIAPPITTTPIPPPKVVVRRKPEEQQQDVEMADVDAGSGFVPINGKTVSAAQLHTPATTSTEEDSDNEGEPTTRATAKTTGKEKSGGKKAGTKKAGNAKSGYNQPCALI